MQNNEIISVDQVVELLNNETRKNPKVDVSKMAASIEWLDCARDKHSTFAVPLLRKDANGKIVSDGKRFVPINNNRDYTTVRYAIEDNYKRLARKEMPDNSTSVRSIETVVDDEKNMQARPVAMDKGLTKSGDLITGNNSQTVTNGENL